MVFSALNAEDTAEVRATKRKKFAKRMWISRKVEEATPERLQEIEKAAIGSLKELKKEIREKVHLK